MEVVEMRWRDVLRSLLLVTVGLCAMAPDCGSGGGDPQAASCDTETGGVGPIKCITPLATSGFYCCNTHADPSGGSDTDVVGYTCPDPTDPPRGPLINCWRTLENAKAAAACQGISSFVRCQK